MTSALRLALEAALVANDRVKSTLFTEYPVGATVHWFVGHHRQVGTVVEHSRYFEDLWAVNNRTGKKVKLSAWSVAAGAEHAEIQQ